MAAESDSELVNMIDDFNALYRQGTIFLHQGKQATAIPYLEAAYSLEPTSVDAAINLAGAYILNKQFKKATAVLEPLSVEYPQNSKIWINLGAAYLGNPVLATDEEQMRAISAFEHALKLDSRAPSVAYNLGLIYRDRRDNEQAIEWFERAVENDANDQHARNILAKLQDST